MFTDLFLFDALINEIELIGVLITHLMMFNVSYLYVLCKCSYFNVLFKYILKCGLFWFLSNIIFFELDGQARRLMIESKVRWIDVVFVSNTVDTDAQLESARELMRIQISVLTKLAIDSFNIKYLTELTRKHLAEVKTLYTEFQYDRHVKSQLDG